MPISERLIHDTLAAGLDPEKVFDMQGKVIPEKAGRIAQIPAYIRYRTKTEEDRMRLVRYQYPSLAKEYWGHVYKPFHLEIIDRLWGGGQHVFMLPTEHAKSTICLVDWVTLSLMENPNAAHLNICVNLPEARRWMNLLKMRLETNHELIRDFPWIAKPRRGGQNQWLKDEIWVDGRIDRSNANGSVVCRGFKSDDIKGRRAKTIGDDLEGKGAVQEAEREELYSFVNLHMIRCIEDEGMGALRPLLALSGTPFDVASIYFRLGEEHGWEIFRQPYRYPPEDGNPRPFGNMIWPEKRGKVAKLKATLDKTQFRIAMWLDPTGGNTEALSASTIKERTWADKTAFVDLGTGKLLEHFTFAFLDPAAGSRNKRVDYAGIGVCKVMWNPGDDFGHVEIYEPQASKQTIIPQCHELARLALKYDCPIVLETNGSQWMNYSTLLEHLYPGQLTLIRHHTSAEKKYDPKGGLAIIPTLVHRGFFRIVDDPASDGAVALRTEIRDLGTGAHDHICAGIWFCYRWVWERKRNRTTKALVPAPVKRFYQQNYRGSYAMRRTLDLSAFSRRAITPGGELGGA